MNYEVQLYYIVSQTVSADSEEEALELALDKSPSLEDFEFCECLDPEVSPTKFGSNNPDL